LKRLPILFGSAIALLGLSWAAIAPAAIAPTADTPAAELPLRARATDASPEFFSGNGAALSRAVLDTVYLLGGPNSVTGKFQTVLVSPGGLPDAQGWFGVDRTEAGTYWNISSFNAENLDTGLNNNAIWSGVPQGTLGFRTAPGYGDNWDDQLVFTENVLPNEAFSARLRFVFNYDTEPTYDFFFVDYDSAGTWTTLASYDGTNADEQGNFLFPEVFDQTVNFVAGTAGRFGDELRFRLRFLSDGAASDEDGQFDSQGAVQIDNIVVNIGGAEISRADFEGSADDADWVIVKAPFAGDFSKIFPNFQEADPCRSNISPAFSFIDTGADVNNAPGESTGGTTSANWDYGIPGGYVVNYNGGLAGNVPLYNEIWSPEIDWDLPGTDDDEAQGGAFLRVTLWEHLPVVNGMFWIWSVRSYPDDDGQWTTWQNRNVVFFEDLQQYAISRQEVGDLLVQQPEQIQIALGVIDLAQVFSLPGGDATPAPIYDNISFGRYRVAGPAINSLRIDRFQDSFPQSGISYQPGVDKSDLAIRLDAGRDIVRSQGNAIIAGDSTIIQATPVIPGTALDGPPVLKWVLDANPFFDDVRQMPAGSSILTTFTGRDDRQWNRWEGEVLGTQSTNVAGPVDNTYWFDLPDGLGRPSVDGEADEPGMFFPGDVMRFYYEATDTDGNVTTAPANLDDPANLAEYRDGSWGIAGRAFTVRGLPSILDGDSDGTPDQPSILYVNDFGRRGSENDFIQAFAQNGLFEGLDYDTYTQNRPDTALSNGIGSAGAHGANADQLRGYSTIFYDAGDLTTALGDGVTAEDKSQDVQILTQWKELPGQRNTVHFGDYLASTLSGGTLDAATYLTNVMGVARIGNDVRPVIDGQTAPIAVPSGEGPSSITTSFIAFGGCLGINEFDNIEPTGAATRLHEFSTADGLTGVYDPAASVWHERQVGGETKIDVTFPLGVNVLWTNGAQRAPEGSSALARLFEELLVSFGQQVDDQDATDAAPQRKPSALLGNKPNPFNPSTSIQLRLGVPGKYTLRVYNVRGELVRTLLDEELAAGQRSVTWNGRDDAGSVVGSGVYLTKFVGPDINASSKLMLIK